MGKGSCSLAWQPIFNSERPLEEEEEENWGEKGQAMQVKLLSRVTTEVI